MSNISKITLGSTTYDLVGNGFNHPLVTQTYKGSYYGTTNDNKSNCFYFLYVKPDEWYKPWHIKVKFYTYCSANSGYRSVTWCDLYGRADGITYCNFNDVYTTCHYYVCVNRVYNAGYTKGYRHAVGLNIRYSTNYTSSSYPRTFVVEYYGCEGCEVEVNKAPLKYTALEGYSSTSATYRLSTDACTENIDAYNRGLRETGDDNSNTVPQGYCPTASGTAAKVVVCTDYSLASKSYLMVNMVVANAIQSALTLNVNGKGAKPIYIDGKASSTTNYTLPAGSYLTYYDGTNYYFRTDGKITGSITGTAGYDFLTVAEMTTLLS